MCDYDSVLKKATALAKKGADVFTIGKSVRGKSLLCVRVGEGEQTLFVTAAIHAREHATATLVLMQAEYALGRLKKGDGTIYFLPCVNPDGADIACGKQKPPDFYKGDPRLYKANARGVDLNVNFDADWETGKSNVFSPAGANYVGEKPFSEPETEALKNFTLSVLPDVTISYHLKGREIYYDFRGYGNEKESLSLAKRVNEKLRYKIVADDGTSAGGYKDWCIKRLKIPSLTIEIGDDALYHPVSEKNLTEDYARNVDLPLVTLQWMKKRRQPT